MARSWEHCYLGVSILSAVGGDNTWSTEEGNGKPLQYFCLENPMNSMKRQKDMMLKYELSRLVGAQYATGEELEK